MAYVPSVITGFSDWIIRTYMCVRRLQESVHRTRSVLPLRTCIHSISELLHARIGFTIKFNEICQILFSVTQDNDGLRRLDKIDPKAEMTLNTNWSVTKSPPRHRGMADGWHRSIRLEHHYELLHYVVNYFITPWLCYSHVRLRHQMKIGIPNWAHSTGVYHTCALVGIRKELAGHWVINKWISGPAKNVGTQD